MSKLEIREGEILDTEQVAVSIIAHAGDSTSFSMEAINAARDGNSEKAKELLEKSKESLQKAHEVHTQVLVEEARGGIESLSMILIHASNHFSMADMTHEFAKIFIDLYERS
jgi:PTS system cellobiose-specific IIA component